MAACSKRHACPFFNDRMSERPAMARPLERRDGASDVTGRARFKATTPKSRPQVPTDLSRNPHDRPAGPGVRSRGAPRARRPRARPPTAPRGRRGCSPPWAPDRDARGLPPADAPHAAAPGGRSFGARERHTAPDTAGRRIRYSYFFCAQVFI